MFCEKCGKQMEENAKFCLSCGNPVTPEPFGDFNEKAQQSQQPQQSQNELNSQFNMPPAEQTAPDKPKIKLPILIAGLVIVVLIVVGIFAVPKLLPKKDTTEPGKTHQDKVSNTTEDTTDPKDEDSEESKIASIISEADALAAQKDYPGAIAIVQAGLEAYPDSVELQEKESAYNESLNAQIKESNLEEAEALASSGDYIAAIELIKNAQEAQPEDEDYENSLNTYISAYVSDVIESADSQATDGDYIAALNTVDEAAQIVGENAELSAKVAEYENAYVADITENVNTLLAANDIDGAKAIAQSAKNALPDNQAIQSLADGLNQYRIVPLSSLTPTNGSFAWNDGTAADPFENDYSALQNFVILHSSYNCSYPITHTIEYQISKNYDVLNFTVVPYSDFGQNGWSYIRVYGDGELRYTTDKITQKTQPTTVSVDVSDAEYIKIVIYLDGHSCTMLTDVTLSKLPNYVSTRPSGYTSLGLLNFFNGSLPWEEDYPCDTLGSQYNDVHNYAVAHSYSGYNRCDYEKTYSAEYYVNKQYSTLSFDIAPHTDFKSSGSAVVKVYVDDVLVYTSPTVTQKTERFNTGDIDLSQATYVKIVVEVAGHSCTILSDALLKNKD